MDKTTSLVILVISLSGIIGSYFHYRTSKELIDRLVAKPQKK